MNFSRFGIFFKSSMAALCLIATAKAADNWDNRFVPPPDTDGEVFAIASVGNQIYAGGSFSTVNGIYSPGIAKWNGTSWESVGGGTDGEVYAIAISGNNVYIGGSFTQAGDADALNIAMWDGNNWTNLAAGLDDANGDAEIDALLVSGTNLFAAGYFENSDVNAMTNIARWNGTSWSSLNRGINYTTTDPNDTQEAYVLALAGNSTNLFVGGFFNQAGTKTVTNIARWNGNAWSSVGSGLDYVPLLPDDDTTPEIASLALTGTNLYAGGTFNISGATEVDNFALWNGSTWSIVGGPADDSVNSIIATNNALYIAGDFTTIDSVIANGVARWTNSHWEPLNIGIDGGGVDCLALTSSNLFAGGSFTSAGGVTAVNIARWNNVNWNTLAIGSANAPIGAVNALLPVGTNVYVGGGFKMAGPTTATNIAIWNGTSWASVGSGVDGPVFALAGNNTNLLVGGSFDSASGIPATNIALWNGSTWTNMGNGLDDVVITVFVSGTNLYAGGYFNHSGTNSIGHIAQWNGADWVSLGAEPGLGLFGICYSITQYGPNLYAAAYFAGTNGTGTNYILRWDGQNWLAVIADENSSFSSLGVIGNDLYVSGDFYQIGGTNASNIARFDGTNWYPLADGINGYCTMAIGGTNLFVAGQFDMAGTNSANNVAKWTGTDWIPLSTGLDGPGWNIAADGTNVYVGGDFTDAGDSPSYHFGIWNDRPPNIWLPPGPDQTISMGTDLLLSAGVAGLQPITYQWFLNGIAIAGATNSSYVDTNIQSADVGNYTVLVSNIYGAVLSDPVSVQLDSAVVFSDDFESGTVSNWTKLSTSAALVISTNQSHGGTYSALATNSLAKMYRNLGTELEGHSMATFWIYDDGGTQTRWFGDARNYSGSGFGNGSLKQQIAIGLYATNFGTSTGDFDGETLDTNSYQGFILAGGSAGYFNLDESPFQRTNGWHKFQIERQDDPTVIDFWIDDNNVVETSDTSGTTWDSITIGSAGSNAVPGNVWFDDVRVEYFDPPDILTNPVDRVVDPGANATFSVVATGNVRSYQWLKNGALISGATKSSFTVTNAQQAATYSVLVANGIGISESDDAVLSLNSKPTILSQPQSLTVPAGANFALSVIATGVPDNLSYQWRKNGTAIANATMSDFVLLDCTNTSAGSYTVVITNVAGAITSSVAIVTITNSSPIITSQPANQTVNLGANATFLIGAAGSELRKYQWFYNGANINGATNSYYRRASIQASDAGSYSVVISNSFGSATSTAAVLTINFPPTITTQPNSQTVATGTNATFSVAAGGTTPLSYQWYAQLVGITPAVPVAIDGETANTLTVESPDPSNAGTYSVLVYNVAGHVFSSNATLVVNGPPVVLQDPQDITVSAGSNAVFAVNAVGTGPLSYQWTVNGANISLATNSTYIRTNIQTTDLGYYAVIVTNPYGSTTSGSAALTLDSCSVFFDNFEAGLGQWTTLAGAAPMSNSTTQKHSGTNSAWCSSSAGKMFHNLPFAVQGHARLTFWAYDDGGSLSNWFGDVRSYIGSTNGQPVQILGAGVYTYPFGTNETGDFSGSDADTNYYQGFVLSGGSVGYFNLSDYTDTPPRTNGWHKFVIEREADTVSVDYSIDDNDIGTVTDTTAADWDSVFIGSAGSGNTNGNVWFDDVKVEYLDPPVILDDPADLSVNPGQVATFTVSAYGNVTGYQWLFNGTPIANATNSSYSVVNSQTNNAGYYSVIALNNVGPAQSDDATLSVNVPPSITQDPSSQTVMPGGNVKFSTAATGTTPLSYQWLKNGSTIANATDTTFSINGVAYSDAATYSVVVTNIAGSDTSAPAVLVVPTPSPQLQRIMLNGDNSVTSTWSVTANANYQLAYKNNLTDPSWTTAGNYSAASNSLTITDAPLTNSQRFYQLSSASSASAPAGIMQIPLLANSDSYVSVPFTRAGAINTTLSSVSGNIVTVSGAPGWTPNQFVYASGTQSNTYYARFTSGSAEGRLYAVTANDTNTLTLNLGNDTLSNVTAGDGIAVEAYWTLNTVFPNGNGINISPTAGNRNTEVLIPDFTSVGINLSASKIYFFNAGIWKQVGQGNANHNDDVLLPNTYFTVRHNVSTNTVLAALGNVITSKVAVIIQTSTTSQQDNPVSLMRPAPVSLNNSGLISSGAFSPSPLPGNRTDELLTFDNNVTNRNKSPSSVYYYWNSAWRLVGAGTNDVGTNAVLGAGAGVIIRKGTNSTALIWSNAP